MGTLSGWNYRKAITVNHTDDGAQTLYQMKLSVFEGAGVDSIGVVYLNDHALNWPTDIQITASDGTTAVDFWREESDATDGTLWIECPSIPAGGTWNGFIYYGNPGASDASSIANCFGADKADDLEWGANGDNINTSGGNVTWTNGCFGAGTATISTAQAYGGTRSLQLYGAVGVATFPLTAGAGYAVRLFSRFTDNPAWINCAFWHGDGAHAVYFYIGNHSNNKIYYCGHNGVAVDTGYTASTANWNIFDITNIDFATGQTYNLWFNGTKIANAAQMIANVAGPNVLQLHNQNSGHTSWVDNAIVRNFTTNEPTWAASGAEEDLSGV